jgi:hypothetical protein
MALMVQVRRSRRGVATMEAVLLMIVFTSVALMFSNRATERGFMRDIVQGPWSPIRGMIEDGVWQRHNASKTAHPNNFSRRQSTQPP